MHTYRELFRTPEFGPLFGASCAQVAATTLAGIALATLVYARTDSPLLSALSMFGPSFAGLMGATTLLSVADRVPPRAAMTLVALAAQILPIGTAMTMLAVASLAVTATLNPGLRCPTPRSRCPMGRWAGQENDDGRDDRATERDHRGSESTDQPGKDRSAAGLRGGPGGNGFAMAPRVSVLMPTYEQAAFLGRAVTSLLAQTMTDWELVVVDDGSPDATAATVGPFQADPRIRYLRLPANRGLGAALNTGLHASAAPLVAYLPSDDRWDPWHLRVLCELAEAGAVLAWSGCRHHGNLVSLGPPEGTGLQLVQVLHRRTADRWVERSELESDDLERLYWRALRRRGPAAGSGVVSCEWVDHPRQRHKAIRESLDGGLNVFRSRYRVPHPLRFHSSDSGTVDEVALYRCFRERPPTAAAPDGLKILLVGELAYNPERVLALEERGHRLYGLWTPDGLGPNTVGPLPFGHVRDLPDPGWRAAVRQLRPDVIYALLNWRAVPFAHAVLTAGLGVPVVWHFKESPFRCMVNGTWPQLVDLVAGADAAVLSSPEELAWFELAMPGRLDPARTLVLDGDLPKADWFAAAPGRARLSESDGEPHTVVLGRPLGLDAGVVATLARAGVHLHLHGQVRAPGPAGDWARWIGEARSLAPGHVHLHPHVGQDRWVEVLSRYDAGWLHHLRSDNGGDLGRATWDDLNYPARIPPLLAAGVPLLQHASPGCRVAAQELVGRRGVGVLYEDLDDLAGQLADGPAMAARRTAALAVRPEFTFDHHTDRLVGLFRKVVDK